MKNELPDGWEAYNLRDLLILHKAGTWGDESDVNSGTPVIRSTNFAKDLKLSLENVAYRNISPNDLEKKKLEFGDILLEKSGGGPSQPVGRVVLFDIMSENTFVCGNFIQFLRVNKAIIYPKFLYYWLSNIHKKGATVLMQNKTTGIRNLKLNEYMEMKIPVPPLETQHMIVAILEKVEETKKLRAQADELTQQLLQSVFLEMFGDPVENPMKWTTKSISKCIEIPLNSGWSPVCSDDEEGIPVFSLANLNDYGLSTNIKKFYSGDTPIKGYDLETGDVLISRSNTRDLMGRVGMYKGIPQKVIYPDLMIRIRVNSSILNPVYFEKYLQMEGMRKKIQQLAHGSSGSMVKISQKDILSLIVSVPPMEAQNKFAEVVHQLEKNKQLQQQSSQELNNLFEALMQKVLKNNIGGTLY